MRGRVVRSLRGSALVCLLAVLLVLPAGALPSVVPSSAAPVEEATVPAAVREMDQDGDVFAWVDTVAVKTLESVAPREAERFGGSTFPEPVDLPGYETLGEDDRRDAWRNWLTVSALAAVEDDARFGAASDAAQEAGSGGNTSGDFGEPRSLRGLWSLESHGIPREMHAADENGGTFVVTDRGVMKFPSPGAAPQWMVKPGSYMGKTATTDANGDGVLDIVIGVWAFYGGEEPSILVVDGTDGNVLFSGLLEDRRMMVWTLTDVDGDGTEDLLGVDARQHMVAYALDGSEIYSVALAELPAPPPVSLPFVYLWMYYDAYGGGSFADVDGNGVKDLVAVSGYQGYLFAGVLFQGLSAPLLSAFSGVDGTPLWQVPVERPGQSYAYPVAAGDLDGDGREDVLVRTVAYAFTVGFIVIESHSRVHSGLAGQVLTDDSVMFACAVILCTPQLPISSEFFPVAFADLDDDGAEELVGLGGTYAYETGSLRIWLEGRTASVVPGGPSEVAYRQDILEGNYDGAELMGFRLRDTDGDGVLEALVAVLTAEMDDEGVLETIDVHHFVARPGGAKGGIMPDLYGFWDYDAAGTAYVWSVRDDRWGPIGETGERVGEGFRLIVSMVPQAFFDHTDDKIPDLLVRKTLGLMWVDGKTGALLEDIVRPITVNPMGVYEQEDRLYLLERDHERDDFAFIDVENGNEAWRLDRETVGSWWISDLQDVTGDGTLDLLVEDYRFSFTESSSDPLGATVTYSVSDERSVQILDPLTEEIVWERELQRGWAYLADAVPTRPGLEILLRERDDETSTNRLEMHLPEAEDAQWTYNLGSGGRYIDAAEGYLLIQNEQEGAVYEFVVGASGELVSSYPLPADTFVRNVFFTTVNPDRFPDLVASFAEEKGGEERTVEVVVHDWANEKELARFELSVEGEEQVRHVGSDFYVYIPPTGFASADVGDWDRDGLVDFAFREDDRALVRSTASGEILALAPGAGTIRYTPDLNGDGRTEIGMVTDRGRLRFFAYAPEIGALAEEDESGVRVVTQVNGTETEEGADGFFEGEEETVPTAGIGLIALALALVAMVLRRRR